jgi:diadenosine tetraphosphate (Ap4A) HIT family hydrolase
MKQSECPFCNPDPSSVRDSNAACLAIRDGFPVSPGHTLLIPKRHAGSFFDLTGEERKALLDLLDAVKRALDSEYHPNGYNIGVNDGPAAGQTVPHVHVHLIPRYKGDCEEPRGGIRWVIPERAKYWMD